jgi:hypothetical protein
MKIVFNTTELNFDVAMVANKAMKVPSLATTITPCWTRCHVDKHGPAFSTQEELNICADKLVERAQIKLSGDLKPRPGCLQFLEQQKNASSKRPVHIANVIHGPILEAYLMGKEGWTRNKFNEIAWNSFKIAFDKFNTARQAITTKLLYSFWSTNTRQRCDRGQIRDPQEI